ncbi:MAG: flotillin family protein [Rhodobacterales bacterium]|nr:flotillin family protein [Rhodobacterales bacterium]
MYIGGITDILVIAGIILIALVAIGLVLSRLYKRASKEISFVRTGLGGQRVIMNGGALVFPVLHETIPVNMNTLRLEVQRANQAALITKDRMRVDVLAEFYVRVQPTAESIANAAQTLGQRTMYPEALKELVEGKFVDALRAVAAEMAMEELHEQRVEFVQKVQAAVSEDLLKNGLELESVSLTGLDQTDRDFFNPNNAFDAAGLTRLTLEIEEKRKRRNDIEQDTQVQIETKNLEAERSKLQIARDVEYARLEQQREVEIRRAAQSAEIASEQAAKQRDAESAKINATQEVELAKIIADRKVEEERIIKERQVREADITREKVVELANQDRAIAVAEKSRAQSEAQAVADKARALAVQAEEGVVTVRETEKAERQKAVDLVEARRLAEQDAIRVTVAAQAQMQAAEDEAEAIRILANADAEKQRIEATGESEAVKLRAAAAELRYAVDAAGRKALNEADNALTSDIVQMKIKLAVVEQLQAIIRESVKPMENIDGIKIIQVDGLTGNGTHGAGGANGHDGAAGTGLADQVVASALRYRSQAPLVDAIMKEVGLSGADLAGLSMAAAPPPATATDLAPASDPALAAGGEGAESPTA